MRPSAFASFTNWWPLFGLATLMIALAVALLLLSPGAASSQSAPTITAVAITSDAGSDDTYLLGETIRITVTFTEAVNVTGSPQLSIDMDPAEWGTKQAAYASGSGSTQLTFAHTVVEPNLSTQGIAVLANTLALNGGSIKSASSDTDADLSHDGLAHDGSHKVNWRLSPGTPISTGVAIASNPGSDLTYAKDEVIRITVTFSEAVDVSGTPQVAIDMDPAHWGTKWAAYHSGSGSTSLTFAHTVVEPNRSTRGIAVLADTLKLNGGTIKSSSSQTAANLAHDGLAHDANHKVQWDQAASEPDCELTAPSSVSALTIGQGAVVSWTVPDQDDRCAISGFTVTALHTEGIQLADPITDPEARSHTMRGLDPGEYRFSVSISYAEGSSDDFVTAEANNVPDACMTLAVEPYVPVDVDPADDAFPEYIQINHGISGRITSVNGTGCVTRETFELQVRRSDAAAWNTYGRFPWSALHSNPNQPHFITYNRKPWIGYDFRIAAYDASGDKYTTSAASATIVADDNSEEADPNSPRISFFHAHNNSGAWLTWFQPSVADGRTHSAYVLEVQQVGGATTTHTITPDGDNASDWVKRRFAVTGLTDGQYYTARVAARTHPDGETSNTSDAWSVRSARIRAWSEPLQVWFTDDTPNFNSASSLVFMMIDSNKQWIQGTCNVSSTGESDGTINCPNLTLVSLDALGTATVSGTATLDGVNTSLSTSVGEGGGPPGFQVFASAGAAASDGDAATHEGRIAIAWEAAATNSVVGTLDAYIVQHRAGSSGDWTNVSKAATDRSHTITGLADGTHQVRAFARTTNSEDHDNNSNTPNQDVIRNGFTSEILTVTVNAADTGTPSVPPGLRLMHAGSGELEVEWQLPASGPLIFSYQVRHRLQDDGSGSPGSWTTGDEQFPRPARRICQWFHECENPRTFTITGLTDGSLYDVEVRFRNGNGWSAWADAQLAGSPEAP